MFRVPKVQEVIGVMGRIPRETIDGILDRLDIVEVLSGYLQLRRAGRNFKTCCPFHNEKTPSFVVSPDKQIYHCFGCQEGGNVIDFLMKYDGLDFPEAIKTLAGKAGVEIPDYAGSGNASDSLYSKICEANKMAGTFYRDVLKTPKGKAAGEYLRARGINDEAVSVFGLGYAPREWEALSKYCRSRKIPADVLRKAGLTVASEKGRNDYDRFRDRIIFPIYNERGVLVAFGGRAMDGKLPKYINSPETSVYSKSGVLYGLNLSKKGIREKGYAILVEGYMDVVAPFQRGINNVVATSGTALTSRQVEILKKYTDTAVMVFDSDQAGEDASLRGLDILVENGMRVRVVTLPAGDDPDSFVSREGREAFYSLVDNAKDLFEYKLDLLIRKKGKKDIGGIVDEMLPTIAKISSAVLQSDRIRKLAEKLGIHEESLRVEMGKIGSGGRPYRFEREAASADKPVTARNSEVHILGLSMMDRDRFFLAEKELGPAGYSDPLVRRVIDELRSLFTGSEGDSVNPGKLLARFSDDDDVRKVIIQAMANADITEDPDKVMKDCILCARKESRRARLKALTERLKKAQENDDMPLMVDTLKMIDSIHKEKVF